MIVLGGHLRFAVYSANNGACSRVFEPVKLLDLSMYVWCPRRLRNRRIHHHRLELQRRLSVKLRFQQQLLVVLWKAWWACLSSELQPGFSYTGKSAAVGVGGPGEGKHEQFRLDDTAEFDNHERLELLEYDRFHEAMMGGFMSWEIHTSTFVNARVEPIRQMSLKSYRRILNRPLSRVFVMMKRVQLCLPIRSSIRPLLYQFRSS